MEEKKRQMGKRKKRGKEKKRKEEDETNFLDESDKNKCYRFLLFPLSWESSKFNI